MLNQLKALIAGGLILFASKYIMTEAVRPKAIGFSFSGSATPENMNASVELPPSHTQ
ncbi:MAG: hypothetical protein NWR30_10640 [Salibacteraceae bacterium]|nr:hypothetical protein [Salibacteraceae bacterium]